MHHPCPTPQPSWCTWGRIQITSLLPVRGPSFPATSAPFLDCRVAELQVSRLNYRICCCCEYLKVWRPAFVFAMRFDLQLQSQAFFLTRVTQPLLPGHCLENVSKGECELEDSLPRCLPRAESQVWSRISIHKHWMLEQLVQDIKAQHGLNSARGVSPLPTISRVHS